MALYSLYDLKENKLLGINLNHHEISEKTQLLSKNVANYARELLVYKNRYVIRNMEPSEKDDALFNEWDNMTVAAELIRTGQGKIISKMINGKVQKMTVPIGRS